MFTACVSVSVSQVQQHVGISLSLSLSRSSVVLPSHRVVAVLSAAVGAADPSGRTAAGALVDAETEGIVGKSGTAVRNRTQGRRRGAGGDGQRQQQDGQREQGLVHDSRTSGYCRVGKLVNW